MTRLIYLYILSSKNKNLKYICSSIRFKFLRVLGPPNFLHFPHLGAKWSACYTFAWPKLDLPFYQKTKDQLTFPSADLHFISSIALLIPVILRCVSLKNCTLAQLFQMKSFVDTIIDSLICITETSTFL